MRTGNGAVESVRDLTETAANNQATLVIAPLNRDESCIVNTAEDVSRFVTKVNHPNVRALLDTYHMNIEESDIEKARMFSAKTTVSHTALVGGGPGAMACLRCHRQKAKVFGHWPLPLPGKEGHFVSAIWKFLLAFALAGSKPSPSSD